MRILLGLAIIALGIIVTFGINYNLGPGLSVRNAFTYLPAGILLLNSILGQPIKAELRAVNIGFAVLIGYALLSTIVAGEIIKYPDYGTWDSVLLLKGNLFDWWLLFFIFFYGARSVDDVEKLLKLLLIVVSAANLAAIGQLVGIIDLGRDIFGDEDGVSRRVYGVFGHSNETAALIVCLIPAYIAVAESTSGFRRWFWVGCLMSSVTMLILTASRGALVGLCVGGIWAALLCQRYLSVQRAIKWLSITAIALVPILIVVGLKYWDQLVGRFTEGSTASAASMTSGRSDIWADALQKMMEFPWTLITGFGWNAYSVMNFDYIAHNQYLSIWFELGLVGLIAFIMIIRRVVVTALSAAAVADPDARRYLVACVFGTLMLAVTIFFGTLFIPWSFIWPFIGLLMRYAWIVIAEHKEQKRVVPSVQSQPIATSPAVAKKHSIHTARATVSR